MENNNNSKNNEVGAPSNEMIKNNKGQLLIESLIGISLIVVGLLGVFSLLSQSLGLRRVVSERYVATYLAAEGIEVVKNIIDTNYLNIGTPWNQGINIGGDYEAEYNSVSLQSFQNRTLYYHPESGLYDYNVGNATTFNRKISIASISDEEIKVNSKVDWITRGGGEFSIDLEDRFLNWRF